MGSPITAGRIVLFTHDAGTAKRAEAHGNFIQAGDVEAAVIVRVWSELEGAGMVNLKVLRDGPVDLWVTSVVEDPTGERPFSWRFPVIAR